MTDDQLERVLGPDMVAELRAAEARQVRPHRRAVRRVARGWRRLVAWARVEVAESSGYGPDEIPGDRW
jgi:hypothetical protein